MLSNLMCRVTLLWLVTPSSFHPAFGPCKDMDCLQRVINNEKPASLHEDAGDSLETNDDQLGGPEGGQKTIGPCVGMDCLTDSLLHSDEDKKASEADQDGAHSERGGPCNGMDCLHDNQMDSTLHQKEDGDSKTDDAHSEKFGPCTGMNCVNDNRMHEHENEQTRKQEVSTQTRKSKRTLATRSSSKDADAEDNENMLENSNEAHSGKHGPCNGMECVNDKRMHEEEEHENDVQRTESELTRENGNKHTDENGPCTGMNCLPGIPIHHGEEPDVDIQSGEDDHGNEGANGFPTWGPISDDIQRRKFFQGQQIEVENVDKNDLSFKKLSDTILGGLIGIKNRLFGSPGRKNNYVRYPSVDSDELGRNTESNHVNAGSKRVPKKIKPVHDEP